MNDVWREWEGLIIDGRFRLQEYLGSSEYSAVFRTSRGGGSSEKAVIKLVPSTSADAEGHLERWEGAARLRHPHLVRLFDTGVYRLPEATLLYVVMEYAEENLAQVLPQRPLSRAETLDLLPPIVSALVYLHEAGLTHGHVRPSNIMIVNEALKISSDGISRAHAANQTEPAAANPMPRAAFQQVSPYDPPEARNGEKSPAGDIWSLGMTLVEAVTQRLPVVSSPRGGFAQQNSSRLGLNARDVYSRASFSAVLEAGDPSVPEGMSPLFAEIARNCLRYDPQHRWTAAEIADRLGNVIPDAPASSRDEGVLAAVASAGEAPARRLEAAPEASLPSPTDTIRNMPANVTPPNLSGTYVESERSERRRFGLPAAVVLLALAAAGLVAGRKLAPLWQKGSPTVSAPAKTESQPTRTKREPAAPGNSAPPAGAAAGNANTEGSAAPATGESAAANVLEQALPDVSRKALNSIQGTVRVEVKVHVNPSGNVSEAQFDTRGPSTYFADKALQAARRWRFTPAESSGHTTSSDWLIRFEFRSSGTQVSPRQIAH